MVSKSNKSKQKKHTSQIKIKSFFAWVVKRKDRNEVYTLDSFYWSETDAIRALKYPRNGAYSYSPEDKYEAVKVKITQI